MTPKQLDAVHLLEHNLPAMRVMYESALTNEPTVMLLMNLRDELARKIYEGVTGAPKGTAEAIAPAFSENGAVPTAFTDINAEVARGLLEIIHPGAYDARLANHIGATDRMPTIQFAVGGMSVFAAPLEPIGD